MSQRSTNLVEPHIPAPRRGEVTAWRVLVVENNAAEAEALVRALKRHGHEVDSVTSGGAALQSYADADLVLIDLELPDLDGLEVCRGIRSTCDVPVIAVTARGSELDRVLGLQAGADDYLVKPYGFRELMARMEAVMRRVRTPEPAERVVNHGPLRIDAGSREVTLHGRPVDVTRKEFDLLYMLASNPDTVIPRKRLIHQIWGDSWSRRTVDTHVSSLRNKLGGSGWIVTVRGVGFRFGREGG
ncbi:MULTISPECIES: response regulator transcription factor [Streptomyces]|uniref:response regulator transcription factor n=1 Tax=Streptomyces TaxID=1883 RepID=UPI0004C665DC|nr:MULTISPECIES: response regulator transcription factor [unclassified Streptomyces]SEC50289.1 DNA-binding response regulator, OmpR family, contains REC and winged-helix (wHTH) domain [Streptomyces sp. PAN_FS17]SED30882.1 DNA-binding response regulator, OmpR family, contains REC and winged-helix (wHTH) domain [Streptomyces sp. KS_5]